jgi:hypothetical protein
MDTLTDKSQFQAWTIKQGTYKLANVQLEIMEWITKQFGVNALDFCCETRKTSKGPPQQLIHVILETVDDVKRMQADHAGKTMITERFSEYFKSTDPNNSFDPLKSDVFPVETSPFPEIIVTYRPLKELSVKLLQEMMDEEKRAVLKTFESVWTMSMAVVFYYTDAQVKENLANGTSSRINEALKQVAEKYGFDRISPSSFDSKEIFFDSKESFDRDYEGQWHYYWR